MKPLPLRGLKYAIGYLGDYAFGWSCALTRHAGACRITNWWVNSRLYRFAWYDRGNHR